MNFFEFIRGIGPTVTRHVRESAQPIFSKRPQPRTAAPQPPVVQHIDSTPGEYIRSGPVGPSYEPPLPERREGLTWTQQLCGIFHPAPPAPPPRDPDLLTQEEGVTFAQAEARRLGFVFPCACGLKSMADPREAAYRPALKRITNNGPHAGIYYSRKSITEMVSQEAVRRAAQPQPEARPEVAGYKPPVPSAEELEQTRLSLLQARKPILQIHREEYEALKAAAAK